MRAPLFMLLAALVGVAWTHDAHADAPRGEEAETPTMVALDVEGTNGVALRTSLSALLARLGARLRPAAEAAAGTPNGGKSLADVRVRFEKASRGRRAHVTIGAGNAMRQRTLAARSQRVLVEQVAHVIHAAVESLLVEASDKPPPGHPAAQPTAAQPLPTGHPTAAQPAPPLPTAGYGADEPDFETLMAPWGLQLTPLVSVGMAHRLSGAVVGAGLDVGVSYVDGQWGPALHMSANYRLPFSANDGGLEMQTGAFRLWPAVTWTPLPMLALDFGAGAGVDVIVLEMSRELPNGQLLQASVTHVLPVVVTNVAVRLRIVDHVHAYAAAGIEIDPGSSRLSLRQSVASERYPLRPLGSLGLSFTLGGPSRSDDDAGKKKIATQ